MVAGTILFGSPDVSVKRGINRYMYWFGANKLDVRGDATAFILDKF